jgi:hypothetical protein
MWWSSEKNGAKRANLGFGEGAYTVEVDDSFVHRHALGAWRGHPFLSTFGGPLASRLMYRIHVIMKMLALEFS